MYWVFNKQQLDEAMVDFAKRQSADSADASAILQLLEDFMHSDEMKQRGMCKEAQNG